MLRIIKNKLLLIIAFTLFQNIQLAQAMETPAEQALKTEDIGIKILLDLPMTSRLKLPQICSSFYTIYKKHMPVVVMKTFDPFETGYSPFFSCTLNSFIVSPNKKEEEKNILIVINGDNLELSNKAFGHLIYVGCPHANGIISISNNDNGDLTLINIDGTSDVTIEYPFQDISLTKNDYLKKIAFNANNNTLVSYYDSDGRKDNCGWFPHLYCHKGPEKKYAITALDKYAQLYLVEKILPIANKFLASTNHHLILLDPDAKDILETRISWPFPTKKMINARFSISFACFKNTIIACHNDSNQEPGYFTIPDITKEDKKFVQLKISPLPNNYYPYELSFGDRYLILIGIKTPTYNFDEKCSIFSKKDNGVFVIFDMEDQKPVYRKFLLNAPNKMYFAGSSFFIISTVIDANGKPTRQKTITAFNLKNWAEACPYELSKYNGAVLHISPVDQDFSLASPNVSFDVAVSDEI